MSIVFLVTNSIFFQSLRLTKRLSLIHPICNVFFAIPKMMSLMSHALESLMIVIWFTWIFIFSSEFQVLFFDDCAKIFAKSSLNKPKCVEKNVSIFQLALINLLSAINRWLLHPKSLLIYSHARRTENYLMSTVLYHTREGKKTLIKHLKSRQLSTALNS